MKSAEPSEMLARVLIISTIMIELLCGCTSIAKEPGIEQISRIEVGRSMRADVLAVLGLPHKRELTADAGGASLEVWVYLRGPDHTSTFAPVFVVPSVAPGYAAVYFSNLQSHARREITAIIIFDAEGRVVDVRTKGDLQ